MTDFATDCHGRSRRLCDAMSKSTIDTQWGRIISGDDGRGLKCKHYAVIPLEDGTWVCSTHRPGRKAAWLMCQAPVFAYPYDGVPKACKNRAHWHYEGQWYCKGHDPARPRCENILAHPSKSEALRARGVEWTAGGLSPLTPQALGVYRGRRLCRACATSHVVGEPAVDAKPPCWLCQGTGELRDNDEKAFPCLCTEEGLRMANAAEGAYAPR